MEASYSQHQVIKSATGDRGEVYEEIFSNFNIGVINFQRHVLVANINENVIIATDVLTSYSFLPNLTKGVITTCIA